MADILQDDLSISEYLEFSFKFLLQIIKKVLGKKEGN